MKTFYIGLLLVIATFILFSACSTSKKGIVNPKIFKKGTTSLPYQIYLPTEYGKKRVPLIVFLHGSGERGTDNIKQGIHVLPYLTSPDVQKKNPCVVIAPQCPENESWSPVNRENWSPIPDAPATPSMNNLIGLIEDLKKDKNIDPNRIYIIGLSMGGFGTFDIMSRKPLLFAAGVPICGGGDYKLVSDYAHVPIWIFHGDQDPAVPVRLSRSAYGALTDVGCQVKYTEYPGGGHDIWERAVREPGFIDWLFDQYIGKGIR
jgi:predicted peptidase